MKIQTLIPIAAILASALFSFCKNDAPASTSDAAETQGATANTGTPVSISPIDQPAGAANATPPPPASAEPAQNATGVWHYTCPDGHPGGAGSATPCAKCGKTLAHNAAYHGTPNPAATTTTAPGQTTATTPKPEPAQNAAGVWHYTCPDGHPGGSGTAVPCTKCSKMLVHNQTYHNK